MMRFLLERTRIVAILLLGVSFLAACDQGPKIKGIVDTLLPPESRSDRRAAAVREARAGLEDLTITTIPLNGVAPRADGASTLRVRHEPDLSAFLSAKDVQASALAAAEPVRKMNFGDGAKIKHAQVGAFRLRLGEQEIEAALEFEIEFSEYDLKVSGGLSGAAAFAFNESKITIRPSLTEITIHEVKHGYWPIFDLQAVAQVVAQTLVTYRDNVNGAIGVVDLPIVLEKSLVWNPKAGLKDVPGIKLRNSEDVRLTAVIDAASILVQPDGLYVLASADVGIQGQRDFTDLAKAITDDAAALRSVRLYTDRITDQIDRIAIWPELTQIQNDPFKFADQYGIRDVRKDFDRVGVELLRKHFDRTEWGAGLGLSPDAQQSLRSSMGPTRFEGLGRSPGFPKNQLDRRTIDNLGSRPGAAPRLQKFGPGDRRSDGGPSGGSSLLGGSPRNRAVVQLAQMSFTPEEDSPENLQGVIDKLRTNGLATPVGSVIDPGRRDWAVRNLRITETAPASGTAAAAEVSSNYDDFKAAFLKLRSSSGLNPPDGMAESSHLSVSTRFIGETLNKVAGLPSLGADIDYAVPPPADFFQPIHTPPAPSLNCRQNLRPCDFPETACLSTKSCEPGWSCPSCKWYQADCHVRKGACEFDKGRYGAQCNLEKGVHNDACRASQSAKKVSCEVVKAGEIAGCETNQGWLDLMGNKHIADVAFSGIRIGAKGSFDLVRLDVAPDLSRIDIRHNTVIALNVSANIRIEPKNFGYAVCASDVNTRFSTAVKVEPRADTLSARIERVQDGKAAVLAVHVAAPPVKAKFPSPPLFTLMAQNPQLMIVCKPLGDAAVFSQVFLRDADIPGLSNSLTVDLGEQTMNFRVEPFSSPVEITASNLTVVSGRVEFLPAWTPAAVVFAAAFKPEVK